MKLRVSVVLVFKRQFQVFDSDVYHSKICLVFTFLNSPVSNSTCFISFMKTRFGAALKWPSLILEICIFPLSAIKSTHPESELI